MANWKWFGKTHACLYKLSGGKWGNAMGGQAIVLMETVGRKSGKVRNAPAACYPYRDNVAVVASNDGLEHDPVWWLNLKETPEIYIRLGEKRFKVRAEELQGEDRAALWPKIVKINPRQSKYEKMTKRVLPVIYLKPVEE